MQFAIPYIVGLLIGVPVGLLSGRFRKKPLAVRIAGGLAVGVGIAVTINASVELLELVGVWPAAQRPPVSSSEQTRNAVAGEPVETPPAATVEPSSWEQEQRYDDGVLKAERTVTRNAQGELVPHGPASTYYPNGQLKWTGHYEMGRQTGAWQEYFPDGKKEGEGHISADGNAEEIHWHHNGKSESQGTWRNGKKHGEWKTWFATGQPAGVFNFQNGIPDGEFREWHPNGQRKLRAEFESGVPREPVQRWDENGTLISPNASESLGQF